MLKTEQLLDLTHTRAAAYLQQFTYPWESLEGIGAMVVALGAQLEHNSFTQIAPQIWVHKTARIAPTAHLQGPCIIGENTEVRHCAYIRGSLLVGDGCVIGNSTELKNAILLDGVQVPHFNYVGDSILGYKAHMGAGAVTSNVKADRQPVMIHGPQPIPTGRKKVGAILGDFAEIGCNAVLNPGTIVGRHSNIYPTACVRGVIPENTICKQDGTLIQKR